MPATTKARIGAITAGIRTLPTRPSASTASKPAAATAEPTTPPISACEELEGRPKDQVIRFQAIAPIRPAKTIVGVITAGVDDVVGDGRRDRDRDEGADEVEQRGEGDRHLRPRRPGRDRGGDDVGGVVEAVGEVEGERRADDDDEDDVGAHGVTSS